jgi:hypothetical protein
VSKAWKPVDMQSLDSILGSGQTCALPRAHWPGWTRSTTQLERLWIYCPDDETPITSHATTAGIIGRLLTERYDRKDQPKPYNYNFYFLAQSTSGEVFQSGPMRTVSPAHHSSAPPEWLDRYGPPPFED